MRSTPLRLTDGTEIGRAWIASGWKERMRGLLGRAGLPEGDLMLLDPCASIHTLGMRFSIDVLFLDREWRVVGLRKALSPGRLAFGGGAAARTLEAQTGWLDLARLQKARFVPTPAFSP